MKNFVTDARKTRGERETKGEREGGGRGRGGDQKEKMGNLRANRC